MRTSRSGAFAVGLLFLEVVSTPAGSCAQTEDPAEVARRHNLEEQEQFERWLKPPPIAPIAPDATFEYDHGPNAVVLFVIFRQGKETRSVSIYGDGRVRVLTDLGPEVPDGWRTFHFSEEEVRTVLRDAVDFGLAEWDSKRITEQVLRQSGGHFGVSHAGKVQVGLSLLDYRHGELRAPTVEKTIELAAPQFARSAYPTIPEYEGVLRMVQFLDRIQRRSIEDQ